MEFIYGLIACALTVWKLHFTYKNSHVLRILENKKVGNKVGRNCVGRDKQTKAIILVICYVLQLLSMKISESSKACVTSFASSSPTVMSA